MREGKRSPMPRAPPWVVQAVQGQETCTCAISEGAESSATQQPDDAGLKKPWGPSGQHIAPVFTTQRQPLQ